MNKKFSSILIVLVLITIFCLILAGCSSSSSPNTARQVNNNSNIDKNAVPQDRTTGNSNVDRIQQPMNPPRPNRMNQS